MAAHSLILGYGIHMTSTTCHAGSASSKAMASASTKRRTLATVLSIAATMGHSDGATYADCVACGSPAYVGRAQTDRAGLNLGHIVADANGGRFCPCNILPMCRACNSDLADATLTDALTPRYDGRSTWSGTMVADAGTRETTDEHARGRAAWL